MRTTNRRKVAGTVAILGVIGLTLSAAASLNLVWGGQFEAGAVEVAAQCQGETITTSLGDLSAENVTGVALTIYS